ncbi:hypothetical protein CBS63078_8089 [Aspergillus niger]|nr:hypothetical protein CBS133816_10824 [Aspergillus niger]KAI2815790.1 hypothetical protein CBS115989_7353 [Aspergillus niger]KAI2844183.1 hypothetical protein CBS11350_4956 [Aspergillus niger]KAI2848180.1 hypothetical protein CBS11232_6897 [Aspergillus niger]KAI2863455.1 hypothetical protein CBS12448_3753 [Aspergillus niger]
MSSSVHFKFKSQKEPSRVTFDGTGISVFELKREIINQSRLGDGTDFELSIYNEDTGEEYDDDTSIIPRSTSVIARRLPASRPGKGGAARYVSGKMPVNARSAPRNEQYPLTRASPNTSNGVLELNNAQTEEEKINALFNLQANQWKEQQQEMANATPVPFGRGRGRPVNVPDHPPPPGYLCYRCREKGKLLWHNLLKAKTNGVEKPESLTLDGSNEDPRNTGVMVNADGDFVIAKPDKAAWELYQEKAKASAAAAAEAAAAEYSKELQARGLECPIDKRMFLEPTRTPCCQRTYCNDCITNALIESDFVCPGCGTEGVLLDNLAVDDEAISKIKEYEAEKADSKKEKDKQQANDIGPGIDKTAIQGKGPVATTESLPPIPPSQPASNKRPAEDETPRTAVGGSSPSSLSKKLKTNDKADSQTPQATGPVTGFPAFPFGQQMPFGSFGFMPNQGMPAMPLSDPMNAMGVPSSGGFPPNMDQSWNPMNAMNFNPAPGMYGDNVNSYATPNLYNGVGEPSMNMFHMPQMMGLQPNSGLAQGPGIGRFSNQQRTTFSTPFAREEDTAYFRQPVNPQRHQARHRRIRPSDYREL